MKKAILSIFVVQLTVFTIIGTVLFFQNRFISMFYKDVSYINVLASDGQAFDAFLSWTEERGIIVSRIVISPDNEITIHMSDWALDSRWDAWTVGSPNRGSMSVISLWRTLPKAGFWNAYFRIIASRYMAYTNRSK